LIQEDAMAFLAREVRREKRYDIILADPPSFSRVSGKKTWTLEEVLPELIGSCLDLIDPQGGAFFLTSHQYEYGSEVLCNLIRDAVAAKQRQAQVSGKNLLLTESSGERSLPAGFLACCLGGDPHGC
jgi:23S rRNA (cytosine1962-C5)-methyltransferase